MKDQIIEQIQQAASSKIALAVGVGTATSPTWIDVLNGDSVRGIAMLIGIVVSITIAIVNVQTIRFRPEKRKQYLRQERLRTALLERQAEDKGIDPGNL